MIPDRLFRILRTAETAASSRFPTTEVFNEGWMLRLLLDVVQALNLSDHPLRCLDGAHWYSEARLSSPFRPRSKPDPLGEGFTNIDGVIGHFEFRHTTKAGLRLKQGARQFIVVEAKIFSNLSERTSNARGYNQAARNVACMAQVLAEGGHRVADLESVGFFVIGPSIDRRRDRYTNLEACLDPASICAAVHQRIAAYETAGRAETGELRAWETDRFLPLVDHMARNHRLRCLSWEDSIAAVSSVDPVIGDELLRFYERCLSDAPAMGQR